MIRGVITGPLGLAALASIALGRPFLIIVAEHVATLNPQWRARLSDPQRRRALTILSAMVGATFTLDGAAQIALALTVPSGRFVADSTAMRIAVLGTGVVLITSYLRDIRARG